MGAHFFKTDYLRVLTPETSNGVAPLMTRDGRQKYHEVHLPLSARKHIERKNLKKPDYLKAIIEHVSNSAPPPVVHKATNGIESKTNVVEHIEDTKTAKNKGGRPKKK